MKKERSIHITYNVQDHEHRYAIRESIIRLIDEVRNQDNKPKKEINILDCGCGVGLFMRDLKRLGYRSVQGMDFDENCVEKAQKYGPCKKVSFSEIDKVYKRGEFDLVILSHVLEHMQHPTDILKKIKKITSWIVLAVPNPLRPKIQIKYSIRGKNYSNKGHYHSWDHSHFENFLSRYNDLEIVKWETDRVRIIPSRYLRKPLRILGLLDNLELKLMPNLLPFYSDSLIVLVKNEAK